MIENIKDLHEYFDNRKIFFDISKLCSDELLSEVGSKWGMSTNKMNLFVEFNFIKTGNQHRRCYCGKELTQQQIKQNRWYCSLKCQNSCPDKIAKTEDNNIKKYGVSNPQQIKNVREKTKNTVRKKYGKDYYLQTLDFKNKSVKTCLERYDVDWPQKQEIQKQSYKKTCLRKYNYDNFAKTDKFKELISSNKKVYSFDFLHEYSFKLINFDTYLNLLMIPGCSRSHFNHMLKYYCISVEWPESQLELEVCKLFSYRNIIKKSRSIIFPLELDIYIPELKLAIEVNGDYWHQAEHKDKGYHINKTNLCESKGIRLIHIWEHEWNQNKEFIQSLLKLYLENKVHQNEFQKLLEPYENRLPRDYFSLLDFPDGIIEEPILEKSGNFEVYKTGYINVA